MFQVSGGPFSPETLNWKLEISSAELFQDLLRHLPARPAGLVGQQAVAHTGLTTARAAVGRKPAEVLVPGCRPETLPREKGRSRENLALRPGGRRGRNRRPPLKQRTSGPQPPESGGEERGIEKDEEDRRPRPSRGRALTGPHDSMGAGRIGH